MLEICLGFRARNILRRQTFEAANVGFGKFIEEISAPEAPELTIEKLVGVFDVLKPHVVDVYERTMRETDQIADAPTIELQRGRTFSVRSPSRWCRLPWGTRSRCLPWMAL